MIPTESRSEPPAADDRQSASSTRGVPTVWAILLASAALQVGGLLAVSLTGIPNLILAMIPVLVVLGNVVGGRAAWLRTPARAPSGGTPPTLEPVDGGALATFGPASWLPTALANAVRQFVANVAIGTVGTLVLLLFRLMIPWERGLQWELLQVSGVWAYLWIIAAAVLGVHSAVGVATWLWSRSPTRVHLGDGALVSGGQRFSVRRRHQRRLIHTAWGSRLELGEGSDPLVVPGRAEELVWLDQLLEEWSEVEDDTEIPESLRRLTTAHRPVQE